MNEELIKRIELALRLSDSEIVSDVLSDCRAALTKKYVPMTEDEKELLVGKLMAGWHIGEKFDRLIEYTESEVIRRAIAQGAKLEVEK